MLLYNPAIEERNQEAFEAYQREKSTEKTLVALFSNLFLLERRCRDHHGTVPVMWPWEDDKRYMLEEALAEGIITRELFEFLDDQFSLTRMRR